MAGTRSKADRAAGKLYVYGVIPAGGPRSFKSVGHGGPEVDIFTVAWQDLAAAVSRVPDATTASDPDKARVHALILEAVMRRTTIVPARFGTVIASAAVLLDVLRNNAANLRQLLTALKGRVELGLRVIWRKEAFHALLAELAADPEIRELKQEAGKGGGGAMQMAVSLGELVQHKLAAKGDEVRREILPPLERIAVAVKHNEVHTEYTIANEAFLVDREREEEFDLAVGALAAGQGSRLDLKYSGPWPPYNFANFQAGQVERHADL